MKLVGLCVVPRIFNVQKRDIPPPDVKFIICVFHGLAFNPEGDKVELYI